MSDLEAKFTAKIEWVKNWTTAGSKKVTNDEKLTCYGLFKQATSGDVDIAQPSMFYFEARAKWGAWNGVKGKAKSDAMSEYITEVEAQHARHGD
ncbi:acyl-CoA-binding protein [Pelagophyceae sp. CCMP2097]|nr:acyl-CoA-binding protein [Pelagophyceae sp. CCMP2097]